MVENQEKNIVNKVIVVTGGSRGIGAEIVKKLAKCGYTVILNYNKSEVCAKNVENELKNLGYTVDIFKADVSKKEEANKLIQFALDKYGKIDILVNNAGVAKLTPFEETTDEIRDFHFDINIKGTWNMSQEVLKYMPKDGAIVNLSSVTGPMVADSGEVAYATTKAAILGFTKGLAAEVVEKGIRVNAILPGYIMTPMVEGMANETDKNNPKAVVEGIAKGIPMKRLGTIEELGELAAFLASKESSYITGQGIIIDGGSTLPETMTMGV